LHRYRIERLEFPIFLFELALVVWYLGLGPAILAVVLSSLAFMAHHVIVLGRFFPNDFWSAVVPLSLCIAAGGAFWAWLYERSGSVYAPWVSHLLVDVVVLAVGYDLVFGEVGSR